MKKQAAQRRCVTVHYAVEGLEARLLLSTYYVSNAGNDAADGLTPGTAWATVTKVDATQVQAGDSILFQRGGEWHGQLLASSDGTAASPITYGDYGDAAASKPIFDGSDNVAAGAFTALGNSVYRFSTSASPNGNVYWVYLNHHGLTAATHGGADMPANSFFIDGTMVYINTGGVDPRVAPNVVSVGDRATGQNADQGVIASNGHSNLKFNNLIGRETAQVPAGGTMTGGVSDAYVIRFMGGSNIKANNLEAYYGGKHDIGAINVTGFVATGLLASGGVQGAAGNTIPYGNETAFVGYADGNVHHTTQQWINCTVKNYFGDQPAFLTHNDGGDSIDSILLQNFNSYGSPIALEPGQNETITLKGGSIQNNNMDVYGSAGDTILIDGMKVYGNSSAKITLYASNATIQNCVIAGSGQDGGIISFGANNVVRFNTISMQSSAGSAIHLGNQSNGTKVLGNIVTGTNHVFKADGSPTYTTDYDVYDSSAGTPQFFIGSNPLTLAQMQAAGQEKHGLSADPLFNNAAKEDFSLKTGSPAIHLIPATGITGIPTDFKGNARPNSRAYDAGAIEATLDVRAVPHPDVPLSTPAP